MNMPRNLPHLSAVIPALLAVNSTLFAVIPAKAGLHLCFLHQSKVDSRFRGNDVKERGDDVKERGNDVTEECASLHPSPTANPIRS